MTLLRRLSALLAVLALAGSIGVTFLIAPLVYASSLGPNFPTTCIDDASVGGNAWTSPGNEVSSNNSYATATAGSTSFSRTHFLNCQGFGFAIPSGATINGIVLEAEASTTISGKVYASTVKLIKGGTVSGNDLGATTPTLNNTDAFFTYGTATELWGLAWTDPDVNASNFGGVISYQYNATGSQTVLADSMRITVYYTAAAGGGTVSQTRQVQIISIF